MPGKTRAVCMKCHLIDPEVTSRMKMDALFTHDPINMETTHCLGVGGKLQSQTAVTVNLKSRTLLPSFDVKGKQL